MRVGRVCVCVQAKFKNVGEKIEQTQMENVSKQLAQFKDSLEIFANKHRNQINKNPGLGFANWGVVEDTFGMVCFGSLFGNNTTLVVA